MRNMRGRARQLIPPPAGTHACCQVTVHGLYHANVPDLRVILRHDELHATLINGAPRYLEMGVPALRELLPGVGMLHHTHAQMHFYSKYEYVHAMLVIGGLFGLM
jgi:hypothetical protein